MLKTTNVDFTVSSDIYNIYITDLSCWGVSENLPAVIEITVPGFVNPYKNYFAKTDTSYDSVALELNCGTDCDRTELPDGVWHIKIKASPQSFNKELYYLKSDKLKMKLDLAYARNIDESCSGCIKESIMESLFFIETSEALIRRGEIKKATYFYKEADRIAERITKCKNCK